MHGTGAAQLTRAYILPLAMFHERSVIVIDAGYLYASAGQLVCGTRSRAALDCDVPALTRHLAEWVTQHSHGFTPLRTYWYDGAVNAVPTSEHERIGALPYVKVRLGRLIQGEQKGVDALIYRDLMTLARERAITRAYLLSGDEDLREGVVAAQDMGVQVILFGIPANRGSNQSASLIREADEHVVIGKDVWSRFFGMRPSREPSKAATASAARAAGRSFVEAWRRAVSAEDVAELHGERPRIPRELDIALVVEAEKTLGSLLNRDDLRRALREGFWTGLGNADEETEIDSVSQVDPKPVS